MNVAPESPESPVAMRWPVLARLFRLVGWAAMLLLGGGAVLAILSAHPAAPFTLRDFFDVGALQEAERVLFITGLGLLLALPLARNVLVVVTAQGPARSRFVGYAALGFGLVLVAYGIAIAQLFSAP